MPRATKIVATLGPACSKPEVLERMLAAGVDVVRLNFSHGTAQDHVDARRRWCARSRAQVGREVAIMADLQGPKIRVGKFDDGKVDARARRRRFILDADCELGDGERVGLDYKELPHDVGPGVDAAARRRADQARRRVGRRPANHHARGRSAACCRTTRASTGRAAA